MSVCSFALSFQAMQEVHGISYKKDGWYVNRDGCACLVKKRKQPLPSPADVLVQEWLPNAFDGHASHNFPTKAEWPSDAYHLMNNIEMGVQQFTINDMEKWNALQSVAIRT